MSPIVPDAALPAPFGTPVFRPAMLAAPLLIGSALLPPASQMWCALAAIILLGVPHGALDGEVARDLYRPRFGRWWFPAFSLPYLTISALVLASWRLAPLSTLSLFLLASAWHFGREDAAGGAPLDQAVRGGLPIAMPSLCHPAATAGVFAAVVGQPLPHLPAWWLGASLLWAGASVVWCRAVARRRDWAALRDPLLLAAAFAALPPLTAFAIYFVCVHAPAHTRALIAHGGRAARVRDEASAWTRALPLTALTLLLGALLWPLYHGPAPVRLLALTIQGLAALTLPHMLLDAGHDRLRLLLAQNPAPR